MPSMKVCNCCQAEKHTTAFPICGKHRKKNGETVEYRRDTCKECFAGIERHRKQDRDREEFKRIVGWPATLLVMLLTVTAIYDHDYISGANRVCTYKSVYGNHAVTIDAMRMCPLTWEFEV